MTKTERMQMIRNSTRRQRELSRIYPLQNIIPAAGLMFEADEDGMLEPVTVIFYCEINHLWRVSTASGDIPMERGVLSGSLV